MICVLQRRTTIGRIFFDDHVDHFASRSSAKERGIPTKNIKKFDNPALEIDTGAPGGAGRVAFIGRHETLSLLQFLSVGAYLEQRLQVLSRKK